jgi:hypothetical protein
MMRAREFEILEQQERARDEELRKLREQEEQEKRFYQKLNIEKQWKKIQGESSLRHSPIPDESGYYSQQEKNAIQRLKREEVKEMMKLKEMERKKREIEEEIEREKKHLMGLHQLEQVYLQN